MNPNQGWQQRYGYAYNHHQRQGAPPDVPPPAATPIDAVHDAQALLAVYPMASVTPTNHVARHLSSMTLTAPPPTFVQPSYYAVHGSAYTAASPPPPPPPPYTEYAQEPHYAASQNVQNGYWNNRADEAVRLLNPPPSTRSPYHYQQPAHWTPPPPMQNLTFQTHPFAQAIFQRTAPASAYPTPPPHGITSSSSSLAHALGPMPPPLRSSSSPPKQPKVYRPEESAAFFDSFLEQKSREMAAAKASLLPPLSQPTAPTLPPPRATTPPRPPAQKTQPPPRPQVEESPDPLALRSNATTPSTPVAVTPKKRKVYVQLDSPSVKRLQSMKSMYITPDKSKALPAVSGGVGAVATPTTPVPLTPSTTNTPSATYMGKLSRSGKHTVNKAYVLVPYKPWLTPSSSRKANFHDTPDLGGYGSEEDDVYSPVRASRLDTVRSSARRTGDRDERAPLEKLTSLIEDVFEAEDSLPPELDSPDLPDFFSPLTLTDPSRPLLHPNIIRKLTKYVGHVARPSKRLRHGTAGVQGTPKGKGRMAEVETQMLSRLLKMLERNVKAGEDIDPFSSTNAALLRASPSKKSPKKPSKAVKKGAGDRRSRSRTPADEDAEGDIAAEVREPVEVDHEKLTGLLDTARDSVLAADCCIALLASDRLAKQLYSEELITSCLNTIKSQLTKIIYPFVETSVELLGQSASALASIDPALLLLVRSPSGDAQEAHRRQLSEIFQAVSSVLPRINGLIGAESVAMSDSIIIQAVYIAIGPFFVVDGGDGEHGSGAGSKGKKENVVLRTFGRSAMRGLRLDALSLIRSIFANHEDQRSWIIEEILSSLIKLSDTKQKAGQFRLRDGRSIRTVSALLLQLVQTSAHDVRIEAKRIDKARQQKFALRRQESMTESQTNLASPEPLVDEHDLEEIRLYGTGLDSATKAAKTIILFLTQRSGKGKATKNSNEAEYRTIFDNLISDLLAVLYWPEWPAASLLLSVACKYMVSSLDDIKSSSQNDTNAAKTMALDHLGVVAAKIRSSTIHVQQEAEGKSKYRALKSLDEIVSGVNVKEFDKLLSAHKDVISHLCKRSSEDQAYDSARELTAAILGYDLALALKQVHVWISDPDADEDLNLKDKSKLSPFGQKLKAALRDVWKDPSSDVFDIGSQEEVARIDRLAEEIGTVQSLRNSFHPILNIILAALDAPVIFMRTKALRALGQIVTSDATILAAANVRRAIESHLLDSSPAVRDAAVELIGKYMIDSPEVAGDYYQKIADRMADTGLSVRKRVIKLLKAFYSVTQDNARRIDISTRLVLRLLDEDDSVKDLAVRTIEELWFPSSLEQSSTAKTRSSEGASVYRDKESLLSKVVVIMGTAANFKDRQSPLEDILHKIIVDKEGHDAIALHARYTEICETLIDGLVDASDLPGFTIINCIRTIYLFTSAYPPVLSGANASTLLPYLKNATTSEEQATSDYLLKVFRASVPHMPKTAAKFGHELQMTLQPMIIKPNGGSVQVLQESVACMCIVIQNLTHDFTRLVNLLKSCNLRLQQSIRRPNTDGMNANDFKALSILIFIVALLGENCSFDALRRDHEELVSDINSISQGPIIEHIYHTLLKLYEKYDNATLRGRILQCLGFLFRAQPTLMIMESSATIMDAIFASPEEEARGRLLKIMQDFLTSEAAKNAFKEKEAGKGKTIKQSEVNMEELVGNTDGFADSGVSSAIVQRYLNHILDAALSQNPHIQSIAVDVLSFTIKQGLAHPLQSFPVLVALETSPIPSLANRVNALHSILHGKHASLLNTRYTISARASFDYQKKVIQGAVRGFRAQPAPIALLQRWYSLVREKRPARQDFLKALVKVFQDGSSQQATQDDVDFIRYMAENFASFDYKTQEEVITVIKHLTMVLSTSGTQLLEIISPSHLLAQLHAPSSQIGPENNPGQEHVDATSETKPTPVMKDKVPLLRSSVIIAMVMLLKAHLKTLYSLSEDKCNKFVLGKKSAVGDRPAIRKHEKPISWDRLPYAISPMLTTDDVEAQKVRFLEIWNEDGVAAEPEDDFA